MKTGAEIVLEWFRKYSEQNGTPTPFEIRCQLELAIEHDKTELKKLQLGAVSGALPKTMKHLKALLFTAYLVGRDDEQKGGRSFTDWFEDVVERQ